MAKKYYVVWEGKETGIFEDWVQCHDAIMNVKQPKYKAYKSFDEAREAFTDGYKLHWGKGDSAKKFYSNDELDAIGKPIIPSIYLFSAMDRETKIMTYEGRDTASAELLFRQGPFEDCDQYVGAFLSIVHALAYLKKQGSDVPIYTRNMATKKWVVEERKYGGKLSPTEKNRKVIELLTRANNWLATNDFKNEILVWNKRAWGYPGELLVEL